MTAPEGSRTVVTSAPVEGVWPDSQLKGTAATNTRSINAFHPGEGISQRTGEMVDDRAIPLYLL